MLVLIKSFDECFALDNSLNGIPPEAMLKLSGSMHSIRVEACNNFSLCFDEWLVPTKFTEKVPFMGMFSTYGELYEFKISKY